MWQKMDKGFLVTAETGDVGLQVGGGKLAFFQTSLSKNWVCWSVLAQEWEESEKALWSQPAETEEDGGRNPCLGPALDPKPEQGCATKLSK
jgi:poly(3-hydroxyalkanoate) synthetase